MNRFKSWMTFFFWHICKPLASWIQQPVYIQLIVLHRSCCSHCSSFCVCYNLFKNLWAVRTYFLTYSDCIRTKTHQENWLMVSLEIELLYQSLKNCTSAMTAPVCVACMMHTVRSAQTNELIISLSYGSYCSQLSAEQQREGLNEVIP